MTKTTHHGRPISGLSQSSVFLLFSLLLFSTADSQSSNTSTLGPYPGAGFNPSMAIIIVILISAFFFMGFFSVYLRQCGRQREDAVGGRSNRGALWRRPKGLDQEVIERFPILMYSDVKGLKIGESALECAVCLSEFQDDEILRLLPKCSHVFHTDCIDAWLISKTTCPVCRCNLVPDPNAPPETVVDAGADAVAGAGTEEQVAGATLPDHVAIDVHEPLKSDETVDLSGVGSKRRMLWRSLSSVLPAKLPRSHSMGHSLVLPGENLERFTLRLPEHVRKEILARKLQRSTSCLAYPVAYGEGSSRRWCLGGWAGGDGSNRGGGSVGGRSFKLGRRELSSKSDRWSILARTFSFRVSKAEGEESVRRGEGSTAACPTAKKKAGGEGEG